MDWKVHATRILARLGWNTAVWTPSAGGTPYTAQVDFRSPGLVVMDGMVQTTDYAMRFITDTLPNLKADETVVIDGVSFKVREVLDQDDGAVQEALLSKV